MKARIDYFPSFEMITGAPFRSMFYESNLRSVSHDGVEFVMDSFFACMESTFGVRQTQIPEPSASTNTKAIRQKSQEAICEEEMLDAFRGTPK